MRKEKKKRERLSFSAAAFFQLLLGNMLYQGAHSSSLCVYFMIVCSTAVRARQALIYSFFMKKHRLYKKHVQPHNRDWPTAITCKSNSIILLFGVQLNSVTLLNVVQVISLIPLDRSSSLANSTFIIRPNIVRLLFGGWIVYRACMEEWLITTDM